MSFLAYAMMSPQLGNRDGIGLTQNKSGLVLVPVRKGCRSVGKVMYELSKQPGSQISPGFFTAGVSTVGKDLNTRNSSLFTKRLRQKRE